MVAAQRAGCVGVLLATGHGEALGRLLDAHGVALPITLRLERPAERPGAPGAATAFEQLQRSLKFAGGGADGAASRAVVEWIDAHATDHAELIWEALRSDVRVYADLAQAADELISLAADFSK